MIEAVLRVHLPCQGVAGLTTEHGTTVNLVEQKTSKGAFYRASWRWS